jgi:hypothetical protein
VAYRKSQEEIGVNPNALNLSFNQADIETKLKRLVEEILPDFAGREIQNHAEDNPGHRFD